MGKIQYFELYIINRVQKHLYRLTVILSMHEKGENHLKAIRNVVELKISSTIELGPVVC